MGREGAFSFCLSCFHGGLLIVGFLVLVAALLACLAPIDFKPDTGRPWVMTWIGWPLSFRVTMSFLPLGCFLSVCWDFGDQFTRIA